MANNNWFTVTNTVLSLASLDLIDSEADFDADGNAIDKFQRMAKYAVMLANQHLGLRCRRHFSKRLFSVTIQPPPGGWPAIGMGYGNCVVPLDVGVAGENLSPHSFFNATNALQTASGVNLNSSQNIRLKNMKFEEFVNWYP